MKRPAWFLITLLLLAILAVIIYLRMLTPQGTPLPEASSPAEESAVPGDAASELVREEDENPGISSLPLRMFITVDDFRDGYLDVTVTNLSGYEMSFEDGYSLEYEGKNGWETLAASLPDADETAGSVPAQTRYELNDLDKLQLTLDLSVFGALSPGRHRIHLADMSEEFELR